MDQKSPADISGQNTTSIPRQFPPSFDMYKDGWASKHYFLGQPRSAPLYAVSLHTGWSGKPDIVLHSGPTEDAPPLASSNKNTLSRSADVTLPPLPGSVAKATTERIEVSGGNWGGHSVLSFSVEVGDTGRREDFEWRHSRGDDVAALGGRSDGWKLVRIAADGPGGAKPGSTSSGGGARSSDGKEVVAVWATTHRRLHKGFRFRFLGTGADGSLGERWAIMAVVSALRGWDKIRRASSGNAGAAGGGVAGGGGGGGGGAC